MILYGSNSFVSIGKALIISHAYGQYSAAKTGFISTLGGLSILSEISVGGLQCYSRSKNSSKDALIGGEAKEFVPIIIAGGGAYLVTKNIPSLSFATTSNSLISRSTIGIPSYFQTQLY
jgi:hypothetical protein